MLGLLLLDPVAGAFDEVDLLHVRAGALLHPLERAGRLVVAPVVLARDEGRGLVDGAAGEGFVLAADEVNRLLLQFLKST